MIRSIEKGDVRDIATLLRDYWQERGMKYSQRWAEDYLKDGHATEIKQDVTFCLQEDNALIGVIAVIIYEGDVAELRDLVVKKEFRGRGYGKTLVEHVLMFCMKNNVRKVYVLTFPQHQPLFAQFNFISEGYLRNHFKDGEDLAIMSLMLQREEKQLDLQNKLKDLALQQDIESVTSERLRKLRTKH